MKKSKTKHREKLSSTTGSAVDTVERNKQGLVDDGLLTSAQLADAEAKAWQTHQSLGRVLVSSRYASEEQLARFIAKKTHLPYINLNDYAIDRRVLEVIPAATARRHKFIPLFKIENVITVAMADPVGAISIEDVASVAGCPAEAVIATQESILAAIDQWYGSGDSRKQLVEQLATELELLEGQEEGPAEYGGQINEYRLKKEALEAPIVELVNSYIAQAIMEGASDIHIEPGKDTTQIRFRIDGFLYNRGRLPSKFILPVNSRIKIMSAMDITKRKIPQDGRISLTVRDRRVDIRVSTFPCLHGEKIVLRLLDKRKGLMSLSELGLSENDLAIFKNLSWTRNGLILATGPTGSGKSTTLYAFIHAIDKADKNIITIEDPVEYEIEGTVQSNVNAKVGLTFAKSLKAILRQDPDIIYVGEIRDTETAEIAVRAALTGHLVLSTLHTNDAVGAIVRLHEMHVSRELIRSVLKCSFAQRLVRKICLRCKQVDHPEDYLIQKLGASANSTYYKGKGCDYCDRSGYQGMTAIYEILLVDKKIGAMISEKVSDMEVRQAAEKAGMQSLSHQGMLMAQQGITTLEEIARVVTGS